MKGFLVNKSLKKHFFGVFLACFHPDGVRDLWASLLVGRTDEILKEKFDFIGHTENLVMILYPCSATNATG